jgi:hypothetical protein
MNTMKKPVLVALWIVATLATTAVAYVAVNAAGAEVTDRPLTSVLATGDSAAPPSTTGQAGALTITTGGPSTTGGTGTTNGTATTGTTNGSTTSTISSSTSSTATTLSDAPWQQTTIPSKGGLVIVSYRPGEVKLESVAPTPGFSYEIDDQGPPKVRVEFEGGDVRIEVRVRWDGGLVTEVDENN